MREVVISYRKSFFLHNDQYVSLVYPTGIIAQSLEFS